MKKLVLTAAALAFLCLSASAFAQVANYPSAVGVLGPSNFTTSTTTAAGVCDDHQLRQPHGVTIDPSTGKLFVADRKNHRVLRFSAANALGQGASAEAVFGQPNLTTTTTTAAAPSATTLADPLGLTFDNLGRLWVCDFGNNRVLRFDNAATKATGSAADAVYGQANFTVKQATTYTAADMYGPCVAQYYNNTLYVADWGNNRVLRFDNIDSKITTGGAAADVVFGQADFTTKSQNRGGALATCGANTMSQPNGLHVDASGTLWVSDNQNCRILRFDNPGAKTNAANSADGVLGQPDFTHNTSAATITGVSNAMRSVWSDASGRLYGIQEGTATLGNRIFWYDDAAHKANGAPADGVIGQPNFTSTAPGLSAQQFNLPKYMTVNNATGDIWVSDQNNNRVLRFTLESALPVELISFEGRATGSVVTLSWKTATEKNNYGFDVERRGSASAQWMKVGFVAGSGTSATQKEYSFIDPSATLGTYAYRLRQIDRDGTSDVSRMIEVEAGMVPGRFALEQNFPNPFNPQTAVRFVVAEAMHASVIVYDQLGREKARLFNAQAEAGKVYDLKFDGSRFASGVYFCRIVTPMGSKTRTMTLMK